MIINLKSFLAERNSVKSINSSFSMKEVEIDGVKPFVSDIQVDGEIKARDGFVEFTAQLCFDYLMPCDICAKDVLTTMRFEIHHGLVQNETDDSADFFVEVSEELDLYEFLHEEVILNLPTKYVCSDDCKGICSKCGADLNETTCSCETVYINPQFESLKDLLN